MRILLDGCVPKHLAKELTEYEVSTVHEMGWSNLDDGPLLDAMDGRFEILVTVDKSIPKQQRIANRSFAVVVLRARTNRLAELIHCVPELRSLLSKLKSGQAQEITC